MIIIEGSCVSSAGFFLPHVQNSFSPTAAMVPLHLGQVWPSQTRRSWLMQWGQRRPYSLLKLGTRSAMTPPTVRFCTLRQSRHTTCEILCPKNPEPSYTSHS